ncbi:MAG: ABC transporter substrate-binding protein [Candidatus Binatia bacterium]
MDAMHRRQIFPSWCALPILLWTLTNLLSSTADAAEKPGGRPMEKIAIAYSSISGNMAPLWVAYERGFFRKHGLDVQPVFIESGSTTVQALISGDVAFAQMAGSAVIQSHLRGADVVMVAGVINTLTFQFFVDKNIKRPEQLKGKAVAVTRFGSSTDFAMRYALEKYGLVPEKDVAILQMGSMPAIFASIEGGKVQGAMLSAPFTFKARKVGFSLLADLQMLGLEYQHTGLATTRALIKSQPDLVRKVMKAYVEGIHYYKTHRRESLAVLAKYLKTTDPEALTEIYEDIGLNLTPQKPYPTLRGIEIMLRELAAKDPKVQTARPDQFVDMSFVKELDSSGFIDGLYKSAPVVASSEEPRPALAPAKEKVKVASKTTRTAQEKAKPALGASEPVPATSLGGGLKEYIIQRGDTLSRLALRLYGDPLKWPKIYEANKQTVKNPDYIYVGQKIMLPADG